MEVPEDKNNPDWKDNTVGPHDPQFDEMPPLLENNSDDEDDAVRTDHTNNDMNNLHFNHQPLPITLEYTAEGHTHNSNEFVPAFHNAFYNRVQNYDDTYPLNFNDLLHSLTLSDQNNP